MTRSHSSQVHLFDIDIPGGIRFMESDVLSAGDSLTVIGRLTLSLRVHTVFVASSPGSLLDVLPRSFVHTCPCAYGVCSIVPC